MPVILHLSHDIGWPTALIALAVLAASLPAVFAWVVWEIRRYGRVLRGARIIDAPDYRFDKVPAAASLPRRSAAGSDPADNVVHLDKWSVGA